MNIYRIEPHDESSSDISMLNLDEDSKISSFLFRNVKTYINGKEQILLSIYIEFTDETIEMKNQFQSIIGIKNESLGLESLTNQKKFDKIIEFLNIVQEIDPIPISALNELNAIDILREFNFKILLGPEKIKDLVNHGEHQLALQTALELNKLGYPDMLIMLANIYSQAETSGDTAYAKYTESEIDNHNNFLNTLESFPESHPEFTEVNKEIFSLLSLMDIQKNTPQNTLLERKLRAALNAGLPEADHFFDQLCGNLGINPCIKHIKGSPDTMIKIARQQLKMHKEIQELRTEVAQITTKNNQSQRLFTRPTANSEKEQQIKPKHKPKMD